MRRLTRRRDLGDAVEDLLKAESDTSSSSNNVLWFGRPLLGHGSDGYSVSGLPKDQFTEDGAASQLRM